MKNKFKIFIHIYILLFILYYYIYLFIDIPFCLIHEVKESRRSRNQRRTYIKILPVRADKNNFKISSDFFQVVVGFDELRSESFARWTLKTKRK